MQTSGSREPRYFECCHLFSYKLLAQGVVRCPSSLLHTGSTYFRGASRTSWYKDRGFNRLSERVQKYLGQHRCKEEKWGRGNRCLLLSHHEAYKLHWGGLIRTFLFLHPIDLFLKALKCSAVELFSL